MYDIFAYIYHYPIGFMYDIFAYIYHQNQPNVGIYVLYIYIIHGSYGYWLVYWDPYTS